MGEGFLKKIIIFAFIASFALGNFLTLPKKAKALDPATAVSAASTIGDIIGATGGLSDTLGKIPGIGKIFKSGLIGGSGKKVVPVFDVGTNPFIQTKEGIADSIVFMAAKFLIRQIVDDLSDWLRGGAEGKPRFIQDFGEYLKEAGDNAGGLLLEQILKDNAKLLCEPWRAQIVLDVFRPRRDDFEFRAECKISDIVKAAKKAGVDVSINDMYDNFNIGGWGGFMAMSLTEGGNPIGDYLITLEQKENRIAFETKKKELEATINKGLKISTCVNKFTGKSGKEFCIKSEIGTPGAAIEQVLGKVFGSEISQLELADEINELISAAIEGIRVRNLWRGRGIAKSRFSGGDAGWLFDSSWCEQYGIDPKECKQWSPPTGGTDITKTNVTITLDSYIVQERNFLIYSKNSKTLIENEILPALDRLAEEQPGLEIEIDDGQGGTATTTINGAKTYYENLLTQIIANIQKAETLVYENDQTENPIYPLYGQDWGSVGQARNNFCAAALEIQNVRTLVRKGLEIFCTDNEIELQNLERYVENDLPTIIDDSSAALNWRNYLQTKNKELRNLLLDATLSAPEFIIPADNSIIYMTEPIKFDWTDAGLVFAADN